MRNTIFFLILALAPNAFASDRTVKTCEEAYADLTALMAPIAQHSKSFDDNNLQVFGLDVVEPICCGVGVAVVMPDKKAEEGGGKLCLAVFGWSDARVSEARSLGYDPSKGRLLSIPVKEYMGAWTELRLRINQSKGTVVIE